MSVNRNSIMLKKVVKIEKQATRYQNFETVKEEVVYYLFLIPIYKRQIFVNLD